MELIGSLLLVLALALIVSLFLAKPFFLRMPLQTAEDRSLSQERDHLRSSLLAERDRLLNALQELDFDYALGKVPAEDYPVQRAALLKSGADVLRKLDELQPEVGSAAAVTAEDRIEAAVAVRRADGVVSGSSREDRRAVQAAPVAVAGTNGHADLQKDSLEDLIASRKRQRSEKTAGFCPKCGRPVQKSDKFCSKCGATL